MGILKGFLPKAKIPGAPKKKSGKSLGRKIIKQFLPGYVRLGLSGASALRALQSIGQGIRKTDFYKDWSEAKGYVQKADRLRSAKKDTYPDRTKLKPKRMMEGVNFQFQVKLVGVDNFTGDYAECFVTVEAASNMRIEDIEEIAIQKYGLLKSTRYIEAHEAFVVDGAYNSEYWK